MSKKNQKSQSEAIPDAAAESPEPANKTGAGKARANPIDKPKTRKAKVKSGAISETQLPQSLTTETATQNLSPATEMEVHHHPQLDHKPKPWKEYILEGFMIFIAVMMGFIAENIRETITNHEHAKQLTSQLVHDLKSDIIQLNNINEAETQIVKNNDTLFNLLQQPIEKVDLKKVQKFIALSHSLWPFHPSVGAISAIKNELHLKQFSSSKIISYIANFEGHIDLLNTVQTITLQYQRNYFDPFLCQHFIPNNMVAAFNHQPLPNAQMRNLTQQNLTELAAEMVLIRINTQELVDNNVKLKNDALNLIKYVTKEYHLEDE